MSRKPSQSLVGRRVRLVRHNDPSAGLAPGTEGTVDSVDDVGTVHVRWDDGRVLGLSWDNGNRWAVIARGHFFGTPEGTPT